MMMGSSAEAVQGVFEAQAGQGESITESDSFKQFNLDVEGPVYSISYSNVAESVRNAAKMLNQAGAMAPIVLGMIAAQADPEDVKRIQEVVGLLPAVAQIVAKFDFFEAKMSVTQAAEAPGAYLRRSVTLIRHETSEPSDSTN
jgi:hypothetical protein